MFMYASSSFSLFHFFFFDRSRFVCICHFRIQIFFSPEMHVRATLERKTNFSKNFKFGCIILLLATTLILVVIIFVRLGDYSSSVDTKCTCICPVINSTGSEETPEVQLPTEEEEPPWCTPALLN